MVYFGSLWAYIAVAVVVGFISATLLGCLAEFWRGRRFRVWFLVTLVLLVPWYGFAALLELVIGFSMAIEGSWLGSLGAERVLTAVMITIHALPVVVGLAALAITKNLKPFS